MGKVNTPTMHTYTYWSRSYRQWVTVDSLVSDPAAALAFFQSWGQRQNDRLRAIGFDACQLIQPPIAALVVAHYPTA